MTYRPDIDGLRGVAILAVVLFHAGLQPLSGGFTGVDVFFVISGFLITGIILPRIESGTFSFAHFYERRARRIVPALAAVLLATLPCLVLVALPDQLDRAARSALAALLSLSNLHFHAQSGYFSTEAEFQPFLHTWSLAVEEQFYLILPPILIGLARWRMNTRVCLAALVAASFGLSFWQSVHAPFAAFYLLPTRLWELGLGGLLATGAVPVPSSSAARNAVSIAGLGLIGAGFVAVDSATVFPGWAALLPCLGAALVILASGPETWAGRVLSASPLRAVGLISYSLYLWHWPVLVVARMALARQHLPVEASTIALLLSFALAAASWRWIERPFRDARRMPLRPMAWRLGPPVAATALLALGLAASDGLPGRLNPEAAGLLQASRDVDPREAACRNVPPEAEAERCAFGRLADLRGGGTAEVDFLLIGDSHAAVLAPALEHWARLQGLRGLLLWQSNCPLLPGADRVPLKAHARCAAFKTAAMDRIAAYPNARLVVLSGRWEYNWTGTRPEFGGGYREYLVDAAARHWSETASKQVFVRALHRAMAAIERQDRRVVLLGAVPEIGYDVPHTLALQAQHGGARHDDAPGHDAALRAELDGVFRGLAGRHPTSRYVSLWPAFCEGDRCRLAQDGRPVYRDDDHVTARFAREVIGPYLVDALEDERDGGCRGGPSPCAAVADAEPSGRP